MSISRSSKYAFLAVSKVNDHGYCGGLLMLSPSGRPLEFHCTAPVFANRAQEILYGATLEDFLVCDQIANALLNKANGKPDIVLIDNSAMVRLAENVDAPVVFVNNESKPEKAAFAPATSPAIESARQLEIGQQSLRLFGDGDSENIEGLLKLFMETLPPTEPFERIYQAISEAHKEAA